MSSTVTLPSTIQTSKSLLPPNIQSTIVQTSTPNQPSLSSILSTIQQPFLSLTSSLPPTIHSTTVQTSSPTCLSSIDSSSTASVTLPSSNNSTSTSTSTWSSNLQPVSIKPFVSSVGPTVTIPNSPLEVFELFFTTPFIDNIVEQSNLYAKEVMGDIKYESWTKITVEEIKAYFGFMLLMGMVPLPSLEDYWKKDPVFHYLPIADHISRDRFRDISRYLHFVNNSTLVPRGQPGHDRLGKVSPVINHLFQRFSDLYNPHCELAVDEAMIKFQGRSSLKQYMPMKPIKRAIKVWVLGDSHNGYFHKFQIYSGKEGTREANLGARVVKTLTNHTTFFLIIFLQA